MEIAILPKHALKLKGKQATLVVNPADKATPYSAAILLGSSVVPNSDDGVVISGPGEFEVGGIKISGTREGGDVVYTMNIDGVGILLGETAAIAKTQGKLKENNVAILYTSVVTDASLATGLATNAVLFYGEKASEVVQTFAKENVKTMPKYLITSEKLPQEIETVLLS